jgi:hypothetical protein
MFGGLGYFINRNMAFGVKGDELIVKADEVQTAALLKEPGMGPFEFGGRSMKAWLLAAVISRCLDGFRPGMVKALGPMAYWAPASSASTEPVTDPFAGTVTARCSRNSLPSAVCSLVVATSCWGTPDELEIVTSPPALALGSAACGSGVTATVSLVVVANSSRRPGRLSELLDWPEATEKMNGTDRSLTLATTVTVARLPVTVRITPASSTATSVKPATARP